MKKTRCITTVLLTVFLPFMTVAQSWDWATAGGSTDFDRVELGCITVDKAGNTYVMGSFYKKFVLDTVQFWSHGSKDVFWAKLDKNGQVVWAKGIGGRLDDFAGGIAVDSKGDVYAFLSYSDTIVTSDFQLYNSGFGNDLLLIKYDSMGKFLTQKSLGTPFDETASSIIISEDDKIYLYGTFALYNGPNPPPDSLRTLRLDSTRSVLSRAKYGGDIYIIVLDSSLTAQKAKAAEGNCITYNMSIDKDQGIIVTGITAYKMKFDSITINAPDIFLFVAKYDSMGNALWARAGMVNDPGNYGILCTTGSDGSVYCTGTYDASGVLGAHTDIDFEGAYLHGDNAFIVKYDAGGTLQWAKNIGVTARDAAYDIALDTADNIYITGTFDYWARFGTDTFYSAGADDLFVNKYDKNGNYIWTATAGGTTNDGGHAITLDKEQNIYVGGYISSAPAYFGNQQVMSNGAWDMCVARLSPTPVGVPGPVKKAEALRLSPNPNNGSFRIRISREAYQQVQVLDGTGRTVYRQDIPPGREVIDVHTGLSNGIYLVQLLGKAGVITKKMIVRE